MQVRELYNRLLAANKAYDFFGKIDSVDELRKQFRTYSKIVHPDNVSKADHYMASEAFQVLSKLYAEAEKEFENETYGVFDPIKIYEKMAPLFSIKINGKTYDFYENMFEGEVAYIFRGICNGELFYMKMAIDAEDNDLIEEEYQILNNNPHQLLPHVYSKIKINGCSAILMREVAGETVPEILERYPKGIPAEHVMWMLERLLNVIGWLHYNKIVNGNIKPENIIINKDAHSVTLVGFSFAISEAHKEEARYKIINDDYTAPEVNKDARVMPNADIYSIGKIAVRLLGGSVKNNGMPVSIDPEIRAFIRKMCDENPKTRPNDAWKLWDELIAIRTKVYGKRRFLTLD